MFRAIGILIILWGLSSFFSAFDAFDNAMVAIFSAIETGAGTAQESIKHQGFKPLNVDPK